MAIAVLVLIFLQATDSVAVDTTGIQYRVGYYFGSLLPFIVIAILFFLFIRSTYKFKNKNDENSHL